MLLPDQDRRVAVALELVDRNAAEALALTPNGLEVAWASLIGASSAAQALVTDYQATARLAAEMHAKADRWRASTTPVEDVEVVDFERAAGASSNEAARATANQLSPATAASEVAAGYLSPSTWPPWVRSMLLTALVVVVGVVLLPTFLAAVLRPGARR